MSYPDFRNEEEALEFALETHGMMPRLHALGPWHPLRRRRMRREIEQRVEHSRAWRKRRGIADA